MSERNRVAEFSGADELPAAVYEVLEERTLDLAIIRNAIDTSAFDNTRPPQQALDDLLPYEATDTVVSTWHQANTAQSPYKYTLAGRSPDHIRDLTFMRSNYAVLHFDSPFDIYGAGPVVLSSRIDDHPGITKTLFSRRLENPIDTFDFVTTKRPSHVPLTERVLIGRSTLTPVMNFIGRQGIMSMIEQRPGDIAVIPSAPYAALHGVTINTHGQRSVSPRTMIEPYWFTR